MTILVDRNDDRVLPGAKEVFTQVISSDPKWKRVALVVPVASLHELLQQPVKIEHVFDF
jgi:hypothetical protein